MIKFPFSQLSLILFSFNKATSCFIQIFKSSKYFLRYSRSKSETTIGSLWEEQTKTGKNWKSLKIYLPLCFLRKLPQTFRICSLQYLKKFCWNTIFYFKNLKKKKIMTKKKSFFCFFYFLFFQLFRTEFFKYCKEHLLKV